MSNIFKEFRVRIAPSPTGPLHIGTARTALFNFLLAKKLKGKFILRIEDTDLKRSDPKYEKDIIDGLLWLRITWDEGPTEVKSLPRAKSRGQKYKGKYGPYRQSERLETYEKYIKQLLDRGGAYLCYCTEEELEKERKEMLKRGLAPKYSGKCRKLSNKAIKQYRAEGRRPIVRFKTPKKQLKFKDLIRGELEFDTDLIGDFSIAKVYSDKRLIPLYNFAVVIDDYLMKISHVIRGEDHIANTPKQILILEALGFPQPEYAHLPLILNPDRTKLSKRFAPVSITDYKNQGYLPQALNNFIVLLGWNPKTTKEIFSMKELKKEFSLEGIQKGGAIFNLKRLDWINGYYIRKTNLNKLTQMCIPHLIEAGLIKKYQISKIKYQKYNLKFKIIKTGELISLEYLRRVVALEQERMKKLKDVENLARFFFVRLPKYDPSLLTWKKMGRGEVIESLKISLKILKAVNGKQFKRKNLEKILLKEAKRIGTGELLWPLRVALTGRKGSPGPFEILEVLGKKKSLERIKNAIKKLS